MLDWQEDELQSAEQEQADEVHQEVEEVCSGSKDMLIAWVESIWR